MPLDIDDGYKKIKKEVTTKQKYNQVKNGMLVNCANFWLYLYKCTKSSKLY